jgi:glutathione peroxidase
MMLKKIQYVVFIWIIAMFSVFAKDAPQSTAKSPLDFTMNSIDGESVDLDQYRGQTILMVNVASKCGMTPQYEDLQAIYEKYKEQGFVILGFPANNFLGQEPGTNEEIKTFCSTTYGVSFPMFEKISVKGKDQHPLYAYLTDKNAHDFGGNIKWNFTKFLIGKDGQVKARFEPKTKPTDEQVIAAIEKEL